MSTSSSLANIIVFFTQISFVTDVHNFYEWFLFSFILKAFF